MINVTELISLIKETTPNVYVTISGSSILSYIQHHNDVDVITICDTEEELKRLRNLRSTLIAQNKLQKKPLINWIIKPISRCQPSILGWYQYHFLEPCQYSKNIYDENIMVEIIKECDHILFKVPYEDPSYIRYTKILYHIYTNLCMLKNGNYQLTDEEIKRINRFHDHQSTEEDFQLLLQMLDEAKAKYLPNE